MQRLQGQVLQGDSLGFRLPDQAAGYAISRSPCQHQLAGLGKPFHFKPDDVDPRRHRLAVTVLPVPDNLAMARLYHPHYQGAHRPTQQIVDGQANLRRPGDLIGDGCRGVEGIGVDGAQGKLRRQPGGTVGDPRNAGCKPVILEGEEGVH